MQYDPFIRAELTRSHSTGPFGSFFLSARHAHPFVDLFGRDRYVEVHLLQGADQVSRLRGEIEDRPHEPRRRGEQEQARVLAGVLRHGHQDDLKRCGDLWTEELLAADFAKYLVIQRHLRFHDLSLLCDASWSGCIPQIISPNSWQNAMSVLLQCIKQSSN